MSKMHRYYAVLLLFSISLSLIVPETMFLASASSSVTYQGVLHLTTTATFRPNEYNYPDQTLTRTCIIDCPFSAFTLTNDGNHYTGDAYDQQGTYHSTWIINPATSTSSGGTTCTFAPASGDTQSTFSMRINGDITGGLLTFIFLPSTTLLSPQISTIYAYNQGTSTPTSFTAPTNDAYNVLDSYCNSANSLVTVPKSTSPFQTQTITFSGSRVSDALHESYSWTGTINLSVGNQISDTPTPSTDNPTPTPKPATATPTPSPIIPVPGVEAASISQIEGDVYVTRAGSTTAEKVTNILVLHDGDRVRTGYYSRVTIMYSDGSKIDLKAGSDLEIHAPTPSKDVSLHGGIIHLWEQFKAGGTKFKVHAIDWVMAIRGSELEVAINSDNSVNVTVIEGSVDVQNTETSATVTLDVSQTLTVTSGMTFMQMQDNVQSVDTSSIDRWWDQPYQNSAITFPITAIIIVAAIIVVVVVVLAVLLIRKKRRSAENPIPPPPLPI
jgi:hypothetical protein